MKRVFSAYNIATSIKHDYTSKNANINISKYLAERRFAGKTVSHNVYQEKLHVRNLNVAKYTKNNVLKTFFFCAMPRSGHNGSL